MTNRAGDTVEIILKVYAHLFKEKDDEIIELLNKNMPQAKTKRKKPLFKGFYWLWRRVRDSNSW